MPATPPHLRALRRSFVLGGGVLAACARINSGPTRSESKLGAKQPLRVAALFAGLVDDGGFVEAGYRGLVRARDGLGVDFDFVQNVEPKPELLRAALRKLAAGEPGLVIAHGGQNDDAARAVAAELHHVQFVVTQGSVTGPNLSSYEVRQEQSAFLAGALAAWTTKTGVVGHMSGIRVRPGLEGRAAYANGIARANPAVKLLTNFSGAQDDNELSKRVALALADRGADVIFTMLNTGRVGAIEACRARGIRQIGNVGDWVARDPEVFIGSAFADVGLAAYQAVGDLNAGAFRPGTVKRLGIEDEAAVRLIIAPDVADLVKLRVASLADDVRQQRVSVSTTWAGSELANPG